MNDMVTIESKELTTVSQQTSGMIQSLERLACHPEVNLAVIEKVWSMHKEAMAKAAEMAFHRDLALAQAEFPEIPKNGKIERMNKANPPVVIQTTRYELYEDIVKYTKAARGKYGLAVSFNTQVDYENNRGGGSFTISHREGHSEKSTLMLPFDFTGKNAAQAVGSAITYSKRYQAKAALDIAGTGDHTDDDAKSTSEDQWFTKKQFDELNNQLEKTVRAGIAVRDNYDVIHSLKFAMDTEEWETAYGIWNVDFDNELRGAIWLAPTKGGIFTTAQLKLMKEGGLIKLASEMKNEHARTILTEDSEDK